MIALITPTDPKKLRCSTISPRLSARSSAESRKSEMFERPFDFLSIQEESRIPTVPMTGTRMEDIDTSFASTVEPGDIIVAGANFGCGSSREHAPLAIKACGVKCVIAPSFARIFYRNAINIGFPILECAEAAEGIQAGDTVSVDFSTSVITDETTGKTYQAAPLPAFVQGIVDNGGLLKSLKARGAAK